MEDIYCVKCKMFTENKGKIVHKMTVNHHRYIQVKCKRCGSNKTQFVSK